MNNFYLITINNSYPFNAVVFHKYITSLYPKYFTSWWHYIQGSYIVYTTLNVNQIYNLIRIHTVGNHFLVIKVDPKQTQGWLPKEAWTWFKK